MKYQIKTPNDLFDYIGKKRNKSLSFDEKNTIICMHLMGDSVQKILEDIGIDYSDAEIS